MKKIKKYILNHKGISIVALAVLAYGGYWTYNRLTNTAGETRYVVATVEKGVLITSISGTGQVSASNQIDIKPKASGDILFINVTDGQRVGAGTVILQIDSRNAQKGVRDAEVNLESSKLALQKLKKPADELSVTQSENALARARESKTNAEADLIKSYDNGFNAVANAFLDLPAIMTGLQDILFTTAPANLGTGSQWNIDYYAGSAATYDEKANQYKDDVNKKYTIARDTYDQTYAAYKRASRSSETATIEAIIAASYDTTRDIAEAVKSTNNLIQFYRDTLTKRNLIPVSMATTHLTSLNTYTGQTNTHLVNLLGTKTAIQDEKDAILNADRAVIENIQSLAKLKSGADLLDIQTAELTIRQRENILLDARENLADYTVRAPFDGTIAKLNIKKGDAVSAATIITTLITQQKIAQISLNEVDAAKIKTGEKTTITFDAIDGLSIAGQVAEIDTIGTISQGVVTYGVKISFDTQDDRVKPGMSVSAAIITNAKSDVLMVPSSAIKNQNGAAYVEMLDAIVPQDRQTNKGMTSATPPRRQPVEVGLSNETMTEIISGLKEGDQVITRTIAAPTTAAATAQAPSLFGNPGGNRGGAVRVPGR
ncbi:MAG: efflux RND transporter periplasmic adaptor subunit [Candidatus Sungbacteria bacterium]|nr:efflux RND transporter periplasmic adaptor subunit [Candidatus Sungbacteria bacterium]